MINGPGNVWIESRGKIRQQPAPGLDEAALERAAIQIARPLGLDPATAPILDARLDDGSRVAICVPPAAPHVAITIRRFGKRSYSPEGSRALSAHCPKKCWTRRGSRSWVGGISWSRAVRARVRPRCSMPWSSCSPPTTALFPSRTPWSSASTGKNCVRFEARGIDTASVTIRDLVKHALRHRPDHIVVGEVRGGEAADLLQALNTGARRQSDHDPRQQCRISPVAPRDVRHARRDGLAVGSHL